MKVIFPAFNSQRYWDIHYKYVLNLFNAMGAEVSFENRPEFIVTVDGKNAIINYRDDRAIVNYPWDYPVFQFHYDGNGPKNVYPFPPTSFHDWDEFKALEGIAYNPLLSKPISQRQAVYGRSVERRPKVTKLLKSKYQNRLLTQLLPQSEYFRDVPNIFLSVCVPGYNNNILDRGQLQYMGLGVCTVSPVLPEILPFNRTIDPGTHYIRCSDGYSDLLDRLGRITSEAAKAVGNNAKSLFRDTCTPEAVKEWIKLCLK